MPKLPQTEVAYQQKDKNDQERPTIYYGKSWDNTEQKCLPTTISELM